MYMPFNILPEIDLHVPVHVRLREFFFISESVMNRNDLESLCRVDLLVQIA